MSEFTVAAALREGTARLYGESARHEAELLLLHVLNVARSWLFAHATDAISDAARARFDALVVARAAGQPLAYLTGHQGFWTLDLQVSSDTLIPRADTERLVELALERLPLDTPVRLADMGTGSGAIALSLASERPMAMVIATDLMAPTLGMAVRNAERLAIGNVWFRRGSWYEALGNERFDMLVSNPPYIEADDPHLTQGDLRHEPAVALGSGADGLEAIREIVAGAPAHLVPGGWLLLEHGWNQGAAVRALLEQAGFTDVSTEQDIEQRDRVSLGRKPL